MLSSYGQVFIVVAVLVSTVTFHPALGKILPGVHARGNNPKTGRRLPDSSEERLPHAAAAAAAKIGRRLPDSSEERFLLTAAAGAATIGRRLPDSSEERPSLGAAGGTATIGRRLPDSSEERPSLGAEGRATTIGRRLPDSSEERPSLGAEGRATTIGRRLPDSSEERPSLGAEGRATTIGRRLPDSSEERPSLGAEGGATTIGRRLPDSSEERPSLGPATSTASSGGEEDGEQRRGKRHAGEQADNSGYAAAFDALLDYHAEVQRESRRVVSMPDMHKETSEKLLFFTVTTRLAVSGVRLRVPASLRRVSHVTASTVRDVGIDMSCNVRLGDFETWGQYSVKVNGVGPRGNFETTIRDRVVNATIRFRELPAPTTAKPGEALAEAAPPPPRCSLEATELALVEPGRNDVSAVLARWASQVEDVPTTLRVMKDLLNERLLSYPCDEGFVALVRRGYAAPS